MPANFSATDKPSYTPSSVSLLFLINKKREHLLMITNLKIALPTTLSKTKVLNLALTTKKDI